MKKFINIIFLAVIGLILITLISFWVADINIRPSVIVLLVIVIAAAVIVKNKFSKTE